MILNVILNRYKNKYHNEHFTFDIRYYCTLYILNRFFSTNSSKAEIMQSSQQTNDVYKEIHGCQQRGPWIRQARWIKWSNLDFCLKQGWFQKTFTREMGITVTEIAFCLLVIEATTRGAQDFFGFLTGSRPLSYSEVLSILTLFSNPIFASSSPWRFCLFFAGSPSGLKTQRRSLIIALGLTRNFR